MSNSSIEKTVTQFIAENNLFDASPRVLLAVSGGIDSMGLMAILSKLKTAGKINVELIVAHINHLLRGAASDADEAFVIAQAAKLNLPVKTCRVDVRCYSIENKISIETAARDLRMEALCKIAKEVSCDCIATAHQQNDNAETIIHRLMRGTSFRGLAGVWPKKRFANGILFVRPLLNIKRDEIEDYLRTNGLGWRIDDSNYDYKYTRNRIRHQLLPALEKDSSKPLIDQLIKLALNSYKLNGKLNNEIQKIWPVCVINPQQTEIALDLKPLLRQPKLIQVELIRKALISIGSGEQNLTAGHYTKILSLAEFGQTGKKIELPNQFIAQKGYSKIHFALSQRVEIAQREVTLNVPGKTRFGDWQIEAKLLDVSQCDFDKFKAEKDCFAEWLDAAKVALPLTIRSCREGDKFGPLGMRNNKKVSKFLADTKICQSQICVICNNKMIIWLCPTRIAETAKLCESTSKILQLQVTKAY